MDSSGNKNNISENIFSQKYGFSPVNPFGGGFNPAENVQEKVSTNPIRRLNGYDSTILNKANIQDSEGEELSVEYRIKEKESILKDLESKIKIADNYGTQNEALGLKAKRQRVMDELRSLRKLQAYGGRTLGEKAHFHDSFKKRMPLIYKVQEFISRQILARVSKKVNSVVTLSDSLEQLSEISRSVDELIDMNVPYGEKVQNYEKLTEYLKQANMIHSKISKSMTKRI